MDTWPTGDRRANRGGHGESVVNREYRFAGGKFFTWADGGGCGGRVFRLRGAPSIVLWALGLKGW